MSVSHSLLANVYACMCFSSLQQSRNFFRPVVKIGLIISLFPEITQSNLPSLYYCSDLQPAHLYHWLWNLTHFPERETKIIKQKLKKISPPNILIDVCMNTTYWQHSSYSLNRELLQRLAGGHIECICDCCVVCQLGENRCGSNNPAQFDQFKAVTDPTDWILIAKCIWCRCDIYRISNQFWAIPNNNILAFNICWLFLLECKMMAIINSNNILCSVAFPNPNPLWSSSHICISPGHALNAKTSIRIPFNLPEYSISNVEFNDVPFLIVTMAAVVIRHF